MEQNLSLNANIHLVSQEFPRHLRNSKFCYCVHNRPPKVTIMSHINPTQQFPPYFPKIQNSSHLRQGFLSGLFGFPDRILYAFLILLMPATCLTPHAPWIDYSILCEAYKSQSSSWRSLLKPHVTSSHSGPNILHLHEHPRSMFFPV